MTLATNYTNVGGFNRAGKKHDGEESIHYEFADATGAGSTKRSQDKAGYCILKDCTLSGNCMNNSEYSHLEHS